MADAGLKTTVLFPKKVFRKFDESLHHSKLLNKSQIKTYSTFGIPFIKSEQALPFTPVFCYDSFKIFKENDIVHMWVPYYISNLHILLVKKLFYPKKKLILTMDTVPGYSFSMGKGADAVFKIYNKLFGWIIFRTPDVITLYGKSLVPYALKAGIPKDKIRVISTGISMKTIDHKFREDVRKEFKIRQDTKIVVFAGLMVPRKGVEKIIAMAEHLKKENVVFLLAGDGPLKNKYIDDAKKLGLSNKMMFLGWRKDMPRLYQGSDILVLPAEGEGLPGVVMEAMSYGVPCVASDIPCIPDLIEDGVSGFLCNKDNPKHFAEKIRLLVKNDFLRKKMGHAALSKIQTFDWDDVIEKYKKLYDELYVRRDG